MSAHAVLLVAHIAFAAVVVGATVSYPVWIALAEREPAHLAFAIRSVRRSDRLVAIPAFLLALVTGAWLVYESGLSLAATWLWLSLVIYTAILALGFGVFGPTVRRELVALERGPLDLEYRRLRERSLALSLVTIAGLVAILALMVARPA